MERSRRNKYKKIKYEHPQRKTFHSLNHSPPPFNYIRDGSGRDNYIAYNNGGLTKGFIPNFKVNLLHFLRKNDSVPSFQSNNLVFYDKNKQPNNKE